MPAGRPVILLVDRGNEADAAKGAARRHEQGRSVRLARVPGNCEPSKRGADFNDLLQGWGIEAVRAAIEAAPLWQPPEPSRHDRL